MFVAQHQEDKVRIWWLVADERDESQSREVKFDVCVCVLFAWAHALKANTKATG